MDFINQSKPKLSIQRILQPFRQKPLNHITFGLWLAAAFSLSLFTSYSLLRNATTPSDHQQAQAIQQQIPPIDLDTQPQAPPPVNFMTKDSYNFLLLGYGGPGHDGGGLSDVIILSHINIKQKKLVFVSIPRDLWVQVPGIPDNRKINSAFALGSRNTDQYPTKDADTAALLAGGDLVKQTVGNITGLEVDYFLAATFTGFEQTVDFLGGVTVNVPVAFTDDFYPIKGRELELCGFSPEKMAQVHSQYSGFQLERQFKCRYEQLTFQQKPTPMDGQTALKFARSRHSAQHGGDFARGQRQQALLSAVKNKLISLDAIKNIPNFYNSLSQSVTTDLDPEAATAIARLIINPHDLQITNVQLNTDNVLVNGQSSAGAFIINPKAGPNNFTQIQSFINQHL